MAQKPGGQGEGLPHYANDHDDGDDGDDDDASSAHHDNKSSAEPWLCPWKFAVVRPASRISHLRPLRRTAESCSLFGTGRGKLVRFTGIPLKQVFV